MVAYLHANGVTAFNEPGIMWDVEPWQLYLDVLGAPDTVNPERLNEIPVLGTVYEGRRFPSGG